MPTLAGSAPTDIAREHIGKKTLARRHPDHTNRVLRNEGLRARAENQLEVLVMQCELIPHTVEAAPQRKAILQGVLEAGKVLFGWGTRETPARLLSALMGQLEDGLANAIDVSSSPGSSQALAPVAGELAECAPRALVSTNPPDAQPSQPVVP